LQEDYEKYQSMHAAEDMYSVPANTARFEIVHVRDIKLRQLHTLLLIIACSCISFKNFKVLEL
jgi:hypothetical protein